MPLFATRGGQIFGMGQECPCQKNKSFLHVVTVACCDRHVNVRTGYQPSGRYYSDAYRCLSHVSNTESWDG